MCVQIDICIILSYFSQRIYYDLKVWHNSSLLHNWQTFNCIALKIYVMRFTSKESEKIKEIKHFLDRFHHVDTIYM